jgi:hypothetical protein
MSKGSRPRPFSVPVSQYNDNMDAIFGKKPPRPQWVPPPLPDDLKKDGQNGNVKQS